MSFYELNGGARGAFGSYDTYAQKQTPYLHWLAVFVLVLTISVGGVTAKTLGTVEQASIVLPAVVSSAPQTTSDVPLVAAAVDRSPELRTALEAWQANQKGSEWAFYVHSLDDDQLKVGVNDDKPFGLASIYKLFLLKPLAQKIPAEAWANTNITERTYQACVTAMLSVSDNPCAEAIASKLGWSAIHRQNRADGYKSTVFNRSDTLVGSAADTGLLLDRLYNSDGYDAKTQEIALEAMGRTKRTEAVRGACQGCTVQNKTGDFNGVRHDAAVVQKDGKNYVVVIFSKGAQWKQLSEAAKIIVPYL
ncbi:serine hydrolase [Candidatus Saccharibacteria bacterium]|nr:serine hydrolase [Candidatus Saccharibacteria bacterium]